MNSQALALMMTTQVLVTVLTLYFFYRVLTSKKRPEPDSYEENDLENN
jgi:hypothetical protein